MRAGLVTTFYEATTELSELFKSGAISLPPSHIAACRHLESSLSNIETSSQTLVNTIHTSSACSSPTSVATTPDSSGFFVVCSGDNLVEHVSISSGKITQICTELIKFSIILYYFLQQPSRGRHHME